jgi:branched-chain amino acid transport system permease protein
MNQFISSILIGFSQGSIYALMALALVLVFRSTRVVNFAQAGQAMVSTYIGWEVINRTGSYWLAIPIAALGGAILAMAVQTFLMRPLSKRTSQGAIAPVANIIVTLGLLGVLHSGAAIIWGSEEKLLTSPVSTNGFKIGENVYPFSATDVLIIITSVIVMLIFAFIFKKTNLGLALRAAAFQPEISRLAGIRVDRVQTIGWAFSGAAGAVAGVLIAPGSYLNPYSLDILLVFGFVAAVIGGLDSLVGAAVGGIVLGLTLSFTSQYVGTALTFVVPFVALLSVLLLRPNGLLGGRSSRNA